MERFDDGISSFWKAMTTTRAEKVSERNRNVVNYKPCYVSSFFESCQNANTIISGGSSDIRDSAMVAQAMKASGNGLPVIVLHEGNRHLERLMRDAFLGGGKYKEISSSSPCFEPFYNLNVTELTNQIVEAAPVEYDIKYNARYYLEGMNDFLRIRGKRLSLDTWAEYPPVTIFNAVDDMQMQAELDESQAQQIKSKLMAGQTESYKMDTFLASFKQEMSAIMHVQGSTREIINIVSAIRDRAVLCFDVGAVTNRILINIVMYQLRLASMQGKRYHVIIDSIPMESNKAYADYIRAMSDNASKTIVSDDFYSMTGGNNSLFSSVAGNMSTIIVMRHSSADSALRWSEVFGQYDRYEESYSTSRGGMRRNPFSIFAGPSYSKTVNVSRNRDYIVKPEDIVRMATGEAYIRTVDNGSVAHVQLMQG